ncbi:MAG: GNAT family N-acetyltransferase [Gemmatimonadales bacterium]
MKALQKRIRTRRTRRSDFGGIIDLTKVVYPGSKPWSETQLSSHLDVFPEGQLVAEDAETGEVVGMASSLIVFWEDYDMRTSWRDFTASGLFLNHDPALGKTLYGAEVMVAPNRQGQGIGKLLYAARRRIAERYGLARIRAGARLRGYGQYADRLSPDEYVRRVIHGELLDPTLTFQLRRGFRVLDVVHSYLRDDPESMGYAAVIEWLNEKAAAPGSYPLSLRE